MCRNISLACTRISLTVEGNALTFGPLNLIFNGIAIVVVFFEKGKKTLNVLFQRLI